MYVAGRLSRVTSDPAVLVPLRAFRIAPRKPYLVVGTDEVGVRLPGWFGGTPWRVPLALVGVADLTAVVSGPPEGAPLAEPVVVPFLYTTNAVPAPNLALVFREPVPAPRFRYLVRQQAHADVPKRGARGGRPAGRYVDGLLLRAVDPAVAVETLVAAGAERVADPDAWLAARRELVTDPAERAGLVAAGARFRRVGRVGAGIGCAGVAIAISGLWLGDAWGRAGTVAALCGFGLHQAAGYAAMRHWIRHRGVRRS